MRRQRILRTSSAHSLCLFCTHRLGLDIAATHFIPSGWTSARSVSSTRGRLQSPVHGALPNDDDGSAPNYSPDFVFDPNSSLSQAEQLEKAQRQAAWRQNQAKEQDLKQQRIWEKTRAKEQTAPAPKLRAGQGRTISKSRNFENSNNGINNVFRSVQSLPVLDQVTVANQDISTPRNATSKDQSVRNRQGGLGANPAGVGDRVFRKFTTDDNKSQNTSSVRKASESNGARNPRLPRSSLPNSSDTKRVPFPDFMKGPNPRESPEPQNTTGWGVGAEETKSTEYVKEASPQSNRNVDVFATRTPTVQNPGESKNGIFRSNEEGIIKPNRSDILKHDLNLLTTPDTRNSNESDQPLEPYRTRRLPKNAQHSSTGYHASSVDADELSSFLRSDEEDNSANWKHLRRKESSPGLPKPETQPQPNLRETLDDDPAWVDEMFRAHQEQRPRSVAPMQTFAAADRPESRNQMRNNANRICGRCGRKGHLAHECTGHKGSGTEPSSNNRQPQRGGFDDPFAPEFGSPGTKQSLDRSPFNDPFTRKPPRQSQSSSQHMFRSIQVDSPATNAFDNQHATQDRRSRRQDKVFAQSPFASRASNPFADNVDTQTTSALGAQRGVNRRRSPFEDTTKSNEDSSAGGSMRSVPQAGDARGLQRSYETEDGQRSAKSSRRAQWEAQDEEVSIHEKTNERRKAQRNNRREFDDEDDEHEGAREVYRARKAARQAAKDSAKEAKNRAQKRQREAKKAEQATPITLPEFISVQHLSQMLGVRYERFVARLEQLGYDDVFPGKTLNSETSSMIAMEYNFEPSFDSGAREEEERDLKASPPVEDKEFLPVRPPVVTIMGHVDHGKTTILDYLRKSSVAAGEAGGITQHIGAFSVPLSSSGKTITFLDTPGHAAFLAMRQRGANVTDIVVLVVAADDSVKPQTLEALKHARAAGVPLIVAINKIDKEEADVTRCKQDLARHGVEIEDYGGDTQVVCVSGKTGRGMDELEESVVTLSEILDHRADTHSAVEGWVLEATTKKSGRVATVLVRRGTLKPGCVIVAGKTWARVRTLRNEAGRVVPEIGPGMPVEVDGWKDQPIAGDEVLQAPSEQKATSVVEYRLELEERQKIAHDIEAINEARRIEQEKREKEKAAENAAKRSVASADTNPSPSAATNTTDSFEEQQSGQMLIPFIIKADMSGSVEAVSAYILSISNPLIAPQILHAGVGAIRESDIELASAASGHILAFNLPKDEEMKGLAAGKGVKVLENDIIYRLLDEVKLVLEDKLPPVITQRVLGEAEVAAAFEIGIGGRNKIKIAGCKVKNGAVKRGGRVRVSRGGNKLYDGTINSLKNVKKDVQEMRKGTECGMGFDSWEAFEVGDQIQVYEEVSEKRKL